MSGINASIITRAHDIFSLTQTETWTAQNNWRTILTPGAGEGGEVWVISTDTADSNKKRFQMWAYFKDSSTITLTAALVDIGDATVKAQLQISGTTLIQVLHTAGANRNFTCKIRCIRNA